MSLAAVSYVYYLKVSHEIACCCLVLVYGSKMVVWSDATNMDKYGNSPIIRVKVLVILILV